MEQTSREEHKAPKPEPLPPNEEWVMRETFKAAMLRAADIIDHITASDVLEAQAQMLADGKSLEEVSRIDRALLASCHLRACAAGKAKGK